MQSLKSILDIEYRSEVIFGYIHRRQRELFDVLPQDANYDKLTTVELLDLHLLREFSGTVAGHWREHTREKVTADAMESVALGHAAVAAGVETCDFREHGCFGRTLALRVIGRLDQEKDARYQRVIDGDAVDDVPRAA